jgi:hypothetical protein
LLLIHFSVFFGFSTLLAVLTRSTVTCAFGSVLFWLMCWGMNYGRHTIAGVSHFEKSRLCAIVADLWAAGAQGNVTTPAIVAVDSCRLDTASGESPARTFGFTSELAYWLLPKPLDLHTQLVSSLQADNLFSRVIDTAHLSAVGAWHPTLAILSSVLIGLVLLGLAANEFANADY